MYGLTAIIMKQLLQSADDTKQSWYRYWLPLPPGEGDIPNLKATLDNGMTVNEVKRGFSEMYAYY